MKSITTLFLFLIVGISVFAQPFMKQPIEGSQGKDFIIVNYVDWSDTSIQDAFCGSKTYDGHQGTDYVLRSFEQMDSGVNVLAAADGEVIYIEDGQFDRETEGDVSKKLGNYIAIKHPNKYFTYYAHLKKNSLKVGVGDQVKQGQVIAQVGSSGNSTDPHLHFEVWYDSQYVVDPFIGNCGNPDPLFVDAPKYDTSLHVWDVGMHDSMLDINALRERIITKNAPYKFAPTTKKPIVFWSHLSGLREGDEITLKWFTPKNILWFEYSITLESDWWYYYYYSFIDNKDLEIGHWNSKLFVNGEEVVAQDFEVVKNASLIDQTIGKNGFPTNLNMLLQDQRIRSISVFNLEGKRVHKSSQNKPNTSINLPQGVYSVEFFDLRGSVHYVKVWVD